MGLGLSCTLAVASDPNPLGFYIGGSVGRSDLKSSVPTEPAVLEETQHSLDERDTGWKVFVGLRPTRMFAAELAYADLGHQSVVTNLGNDVSMGFSLHSTVLQRVPTLSTLFYLPIPVPVLDVYGRAGVARLESSGTTQVVCTGFCPQIIIPPVQINRTDTDFLYGAGVQLKFSALAVRLEYERINDARGDPDLLSAGVLWIF